ncbi:TPA: conjugal transfer protein [Listeria monocytogenes]|nr:conjugal transfer protein [Listeria monocytogenes]HAA9071015.1 conjugal transfer protein [Listeria monocytogenes]HDI4828568.1 conjugal transfer protein [Listeria monocytogenes]HDM9928149.1 conjugal transfer protein [Listeria monocytogenes]
MKIHIERKPKKVKEPKINKRKTKTIHVGTRKKSVLFLWGLLVASITFGIYKNLTAIDQHTVHETKVIEEKIIDTHGIENFVTNFIYDFYSWENTKEGLEKRIENINYYLTPQLQQINADMIRSDIPTSSTVTKAQIWNIEPLDENNFSVTYSVTQEIKEKKEASTASSSYKLVIHQDSDNNFIIVKNPIIWSSPTHSDYEPKEEKNDSSIDEQTQKEIENFLETFFKLYPTATKEELAYYSKENILPVINNQNLLYLELVEVVIQANKGDFKVGLIIKNLDLKSKSVLVFKYDLIIQRENNWFIIKNE